MHPWPLTRFWRLKISGTIHAGAHEGEEAPVYSKYRFGPVVWIEAIPELADRLRLKTSMPDRVINATLWSTPGEILNFKITNSTGSSSVFELADHRVKHPEIQKEREITVTTTTIDELGLDEESNLLVLDLQGAEYQTLRGSMNKLKSVDYVISEVNRIMLYEGINLVSDIDKLLNESGFIRVATRWTRFGWGEALFIRRSLLGTEKLSAVKLRVRIAAYWFWLRVFEIPIVYLRSKARHGF